MSDTSNQPAAEPVFTLGDVEPVTALYRHPITGRTVAYRDAHGHTFTATGVYAGPDPDFKPATNKPTKENNKGK